MKIINKASLNFYYPFSFRGISIGKAVRLTAIFFLFQTSLQANSAIGVSMEITHILPKQDGSYNVQCNIYLANLTNDTVWNLQIANQLQKVFISPVNYKICSIGSGSSRTNTMALNYNFGKSEKDSLLILNKSYLLPLQTAEIFYILNINLNNSEIKTFYNWARVSATDANKNPVQLFTCNGNAVKLNTQSDKFDPTPLYLSMSKTIAPNIFIPGNDKFNETSLIEKITIGVSQFQSYNSYQFYLYYEERRIEIFTRTTTYEKKSLC